MQLKQSQHLLWSILELSKVEGDGSLVPRQVRLFSAWGIEI